MPLLYLSNIWPKISIYLMNDFSIDQYLTGVNTIVISNYLVKFVFPIKNVISAIKVAWTCNICLQNISIQIINLEGFTSKNFVNLYCYRSEVINPKYFNSFEEFNSYVILIWEDFYNKNYEDNKSEDNKSEDNKSEDNKSEDILVNSYSINSYSINYSNTFFLCYYLLLIVIFIFLLL